LTFRQDENHENRSYPSASSLFYLRQPGALIFTRHRKMDVGASNPTHTRNHDRGILLSSSIPLRPLFG